MSPDAGLFESLSVSSNPASGLSPPGLVHIKRGESSENKRKAIEFTI